MDDETRAKIREAWSEVLRKNYGRAEEILEALAESDDEEAQS